MTMALQSILFMGAVSMAFAALTLAPRWAQVLWVYVGVGGAGVLFGHAVIHLDAGVLLGGFMVLAGFLALDRVLLALRRPLPLPGVTPGGADAPGASGERAEARTASGPGVPSMGEPTAGRAGRPCAFSARGR